MNRNTDDLKTISDEMIRVWYENPNEALSLIPMMDCYTESIRSLFLKMCKAAMGDEDRRKNTYCMLAENSRKEIEHLGLKDADEFLVIFNNLTPHPLLTGEGDRKLWYDSIYIAAKELEEEMIGGRTYSENDELYFV